MFRRRKMIQIGVSLFLSLATLPSAQAQTGTEPVAPGAGPVTPPANSPAAQCKATSTDKAGFRACLKTARKAAFQTCAQSAGFVPGEGQTPTAEQKTAIGQCMQAAGFHRWHHARHQSQN